MRCTGVRRSGARTCTWIGRASKDRSSRRSRAAATALASRTKGTIASRVRSAPALERHPHAAPEPQRIDLEHEPLVRPAGLGEHPDRGLVAVPDARVHTCEAAASHLDSSMREQPPREATTPELRIGLDLDELRLLVGERPEVALAAVAFAVPDPTGTRAFTADEEAEADG